MWRHTLSLFVRLIVRSSSPQARAAWTWEISFWCSLEDLLISDCLWRLMKSCLIRQTCIQQSQQFDWSSVISWSLISTNGKWFVGYLISTSADVDGTVVFKKLADSFGCADGASWEFWASFAKSGQSNHGGNTVWSRGWFHFLWICHKSILAASIECVRVEKWLHCSWHTLSSNVWRCFYSNKMIFHLPPIRFTLFTIYLPFDS